MGPNEEVHQNIIEYEIELELNFSFATFEKLISLYKNALFWEKDNDETQFNFFFARVKHFLHNQEVIKGLKEIDVIIQPDTQIDFPFCESLLQKVHHYNETKKNQEENLNLLAKNIIDDATNQQKKNKINLKRTDLINDCVREQRDDFLLKLCVRRSKLKDYAEPQTALVEKPAEEKPKTYFPNVLKFNDLDILPESQKILNHGLIKALYMPGTLVSLSQNIGTRHEKNLNAIRNYIDVYACKYNRYVYYNYFNKAVEKCESLFRKKFEAYKNGYKEYYCQMYETKKEMEEDDEYADDIVVLLLAMEEESKNSLNDIEDKYDTLITNEFNAFKDLSFRRKTEFEKQMMERAKMNIINEIKKIFNV